MNSLHNESSNFLRKVFSLLRIPQQVMLLVAELTFIGIPSFRSTKQYKANFPTFSLFLDCVSYKCFDVANKIVCVFSEINLGGSSKQKNATHQGFLTGVVLDPSLSLISSFDNKLIRVSCFSTTGLSPADIIGESVSCTETSPM